MTNGLWKWIVTAIFFLVAYRFRYRMLNILLGNFFLRKFAVKFIMNIPGFRSKIIQSTF
ncbi:hypothetical protein [Falsibacillus albus]|uniref:hypothetical protein n=1 Tax=Falsibacillus albus TaxID=2478915 RepID=UPI0018F30DA1|nr:hypothetical protein [Falsibacillus albus]